MGKSMGGLANSEKSSMDNWHARIASDQNDILRKPLDLLITYISRAITGQDVEYKLCFKPLTVLSDKEEAEIEKIKADANRVQADADCLYITNNVIDSNEVRKERGEEYDIEEGSELDPLTVTAAESGSV